ncbi:GlcNAc-transferase family protein [Verrucomicrobium sp. BvORR106]|uniref:GlcNAc-transferase family protein n=1 Tax=Verrucomicrobium sp. BvORR106 TaxID=1403819 RepID=UPI0006907CB4|nr:GlcNAc-transferase family protein [Verrucomicrobium sp. BvORR106]
MIYVQIAAYRDPELIPTLEDCISKAKYKNDLTFGICWQSDSEDRRLDEWKTRSNFRIDEVPWQESKGLCWARSRIQKMYEGESFTLQLDSHHRFEKEWDRKLLSDLESIGSRKPILTTYAGVYDPPTNTKAGNEPFKMVADRFTPSGTILFRPHLIPNWRDLTGPVRARFVSGHYFFTIGQHCEEYAYDPNLYFAGDEISLSIRSYTLGYDLFHPHRTLVWHEYTRKGRVKHWDDHTTANKELVGAAWHERDVVSKKRLRKLLKEEENEVELGRYGLGSVRSHRDYEIYAGINFAERLLHNDTIAGKEPPSTFSTEAEWARQFARNYTLTYSWQPTDVLQADDLQFVYFGIEDANGKVLYRHDAPYDSLEALGSVQERRVQFLAGSSPARLVVWPVSRSQGWMKKTVYSL